MSLRGGRQADEAIPPLTWREIASSLERAPGSRKDIKVCLCEKAARPTKQSPLSPERRLLRCARKDIKDIKVCLCEKAARPTKPSPLPPGGRLLQAWKERQALAKTPETCLCEERFLRRSNPPESRVHSQRTIAENK